MILLLAIYKRLDPSPEGSLVEGTLVEGSLVEGSLVFGAKEKWNPEKAFKQLGPYNYKCSHTEIKPKTNYY